jgi:hypothetical protein
MKPSQGIFVVLLVVSICSLSEAFPSPRPVLMYSTLSTSTQIHAEPNNNTSNRDGGGPLSFLFNPYQSKIPKEIEKEIYEAEGNTPAAKDRSKRVTGYAVVAVIGLLMAFFNGFLTELRATPMPDGEAFSLDDAGFGWVQSNILTQFFFLNKIGGGLSLLTGAGAGLLAEAEYDTRRLNAERIYEELVRRREAKFARETSSSLAKKKKKQRASTKEKKRLRALSEVVDQPSESTDSTSHENSSFPEQETTTAAESETNQSSETKEGGMLSSLKNFYQRADSMAASQALLLNKKLEDAGVLEKITDESGLRVVGKQETEEKDISDEGKPTP